MKLRILNLTLVSAVAIAGKVAIAEKSANTPSIVRHAYGPSGKENFIRVSLFNSDPKSEDASTKFVEYESCSNNPFLSCKSIGPQKRYSLKEVSTCLDLVKACHKDTLAGSAVVGSMGGLGQACLAMGGIGLTGGLHALGAVFLLNGFGLIVPTAVVNHAANFDDIERSGAAMNAKAMTNSAPEITKIEITESPTVAAKKLDKLLKFCGDPENKKDSSYNESSSETTPTHGTR